MEDPHVGPGSGGAEAGKDGTEIGLPVESISLEKTVSGKRQDGFWVPGSPRCPCLRPKH